MKINDNSRQTTLRAKERAFVTSHVNIYVRGKGVHRRKLPQCKFSFLYRVRIEIILLFCELSLINVGVVGQMRLLIHSGCAVVN